MSWVHLAQSHQLLPLCSAPWYGLTLSPEGTLGCHNISHKLLESIQKRATNMVKGLQGTPYKELPKSLGLLSLKETEGRSYCGFLARGRH